MKATRIALGVGMAVALAWVSVPRVAYATMEIEKKAKDDGYPATSCTYCHTEKMPKKGAAPLNDRGKFLQSEKEKRKAKEVDPAWLKDYKESEKK